MMRSFGILAFISAAAVGMPAAAGEDWRTALEQALRLEVQFTKLTFEGDISTVGSKYIMKIENIQAMPTHGYLPNSNVIENGSRKQPKFADRAVTGILNAGKRKTSGMQIEPGSSVGILKLNVGKDSVVAEIVTLKQEKVELKGSTQSQYLYTILEFPF